MEMKHPLLGSAGPGSLSSEVAVFLQDEIIVEYSKPEVQQKLRDLADKMKVKGQEQAALAEREAFLLEIQIPIVSKYGFEPSAKGVHECMGEMRQEQVGEGLIYKQNLLRNNCMEMMLAGGRPLQSFWSTRQQLDIKFTGEYRAPPLAYYPLIDFKEFESMSEGRVVKVPNKKAIKPEVIDEITAACKQGDSSKVSQLLGSGKKVSESSKAILLNIGYKGLGPAGIKTLVKAFSSDLEKLEVDVSGNQMGLEGAKALAEGLPKNLKVLKLNLSNNRMNAAGVKAIAKGVAQVKNVEVLMLGFAGMKMGPEGAKAIAEGMPKQVKQYNLDLFGNECKDEGIIAISRALPKTIENLNILMTGNLVSRKAFYVFDRQIDDPKNDYYLPLLKNDNFRKTGEIEVHEFKEDLDGHLTRQIELQDCF